jgi:hypothetical protein
MMGAQRLLASLIVSRQKLANVQQAANLCSTPVGIGDRFTGSVADLPTAR